MLGHHEQEGWAAGMREQQHQKEQKNKDINVSPSRLGCPTVMVWGVTRSLLLPRSSRWASKGGGVGSGG